MKAGTRAPQAGAPDGGSPARRAMVRWAWRLFRREWRQQALVLGLLIVSVAAMTVGLGVVSNIYELKADPSFGTANTIVTLSSPGRHLDADLAALRARFGPIAVVGHQDLTVPGSVSSIDLRAEDPESPFVRPMLGLVSGQYPRGADEVALTQAVARTLGLHVGGTWRQAGRVLNVVGLVENPLDLLDRFALVAPGQLSARSDVSVLLDAGPHGAAGLALPGHTALDVNSRGTGSKVTAQVLVLVLGTVGLVFVGLMAVAGFSVMAQRRQRALGVLGSLGATDRHVHLVMLANGAVLGATAAVSGTVAGLAAWAAFVPELQSIAEHRVDFLSLPWWGIAAGAVLSFGTAVAAAWWPARTVARRSIVAALSGRPGKPQPARRSAVLGAVLFGAGLLFLGFAHQQRALFIVGGSLCSVVGLLALAPLALPALAAAVRRSPLAIRLAVRDLSRFQARSGAALGAITLAVAIAATIALSAAAYAAPTAAGNLPPNQLVVYLTSDGMGSQIPPTTAAQLRAGMATVRGLGAVLGARTVLPLYQAVSPTTTMQPAQTGPGGVPAGYPTAILARVTTSGQGVDISQADVLYVATPALLAQYGVRPGEVNGDADIVTSQRGLGGLQVSVPVFGPSPVTRTAGGRPPLTGIAHPVVQVLGQLPDYTSSPATLITVHAMRALGLREIFSAWSITTAGPLTAAQVDTADKAAAGAGLYVETRTVPKSLAPLRNWATAAGILLALGVLGMTVGLIRSETANDLRVLAAAGATSGMRRSLTAATAGALALLGALLGTAGAYLALVAAHRSNLSPLGNVPSWDVVLIVVGLPVLAAGAGWSLAGRQPPAMARRALD